MISNHEVSYLWTAVKQKAHLLNDHQPILNPQPKSNHRGNDCLSTGSSGRSTNYLPWDSEQSKIFPQVCKKDNAIHSPKYNLEAMCVCIPSRQCLESHSVSSFKHARNADIIKAEWERVRGKEQTVLPGDLKIRDHFLNNRKNNTFHPNSQVFKPQSYVSGFFLRQVLK